MNKSDLICRQDREVCTASWQAHGLSCIVHTFSWSAAPLPFVLQLITKAFAAHRIPTVLLSAKQGQGIPKVSVCGSNTKNKRGERQCETDHEPTRSVLQLVDVITRHCKSEFRVAGGLCLVAGVPNVGKSTMINAMRQYAMRGGRNRRSHGTRLSWQRRKAHTTLADWCNCSTPPCSGSHRTTARSDKACFQHSGQCSYSCCHPPSSAV